MAWSKFPWGRSVLFCLSLLGPGGLAQVAKQETKVVAVAAGPAGDAPAKPADAEAVTPVVDAAKSENEASASEAASPTSPSTTAAAKGGAALRNENVFASKLDTETAKADQKRLGGSYQPIFEAPVESNYYAAEYGRSVGRGITLTRSGVARTWHGELFEQHQNSVFNARSFFQAGPVKPSRLNTYGLRFSGGLPRWGFLTGSWSQVKNRGMVNGNVLVPLMSERTPTTTDPRKRAIVERFLAAFPREVPNRTDIDERALNTNAPQTANTTQGSLRLDGRVSAHSTIALSHTINRDNLRAFQLVAGQNPDTDIHSQVSRVTYTLAPSANSEFSLSAGYNRLRSALLSEPNAVGPSVKFSRQLENLGPNTNFPLNRAENTFRYAALGTLRLAGGHHTLTYGGNFLRYQFNGFEQYGTRGEFGFSNNFGLSAIDNLLAAQPTTYEVIIGNMFRGFRSWGTDVFVADRWVLHPRLQVYIGLAHGVSATPVEVNGLNELPYKTDANNFSPRFSFAWRSPGDMVVRASYTTSFGQIYPVTYSQIRYNAPNAIFIRVNNPDLVNPLAGVPLDRGARSSITRFSPNLVAPYSHQYGMTLERSFGPLTLEAAYIGSRTIKLLSAFQHNRAEVDGYAPSELTTASINSRRADPNFYDVVRIVNAGVAYLDAGRVSWSLRPHAGFVGGGSYTLSKALDSGTSFNSTAANKDRDIRSQYQYETLHDLKARSEFDSPHAFTLYGVYRAPAFDNASMGRVLGHALANWQISTNLVFKSGTPFTLSTSDAPGFGNVDGQGGDRPMLLDPSILGATVGDPTTSTQILSRDKFAFIPLGGRAGNLGANVFRSQAIANVNASVAREWNWKMLGGDRTYKLRFQADAYNLTNHAQFAEPNSNLATKVFGKITNTLNNGRALELALRLSF